MQTLVKELLKSKLSRRGFLAGMAAAGYSASAAQSALQSVAPFVPRANVPAELTRLVTGTGGELMTDQIIEAGGRYMFVRNGSGLGPLCDALVSRPQIQLIQATHEGQAVAIADGYAKASGKIGFVMYSRVGLPNSTSNMYNAMKDRTPLVIFSDHAETNREGTESHEDIDDWLEAVKQYTKWRWVVEQPNRIPEFVRQACKVASVMPGGPTHVRIPRDILYRGNVSATVFAGDAFHIPMELRPDTKEVERAAQILLDAQSPLLYCGPEVSQCHANAALLELAELLGIPAVQARSFYSDFPNFHPLCLGEPPLARRYPGRIDCFLNFGARASESQQFTRGAKVIHASVDPETIGRNTALSAALLGDLNQVARALIEAIKSMAPAHEISRRASERRTACEAFTRKMREDRVKIARQMSGAPVPWPRLMVELNDQLDRDAAFVVELGFEAKILNFFSFGENAKLKIGRTEGRALGWGSSAATGVKLALPNRQVVSFQGDGGFLFGQTDSLWTQSRYDIPVLTIITNNQSYEETRWQIMGEGGVGGQPGPAGLANRDYVSFLGDPEVDFTKLAAAYNINGAIVRNSDELRPAIERAIRTLRDGRPYMLDVRIERFGVGANATWYPKYSLAQTRDRQA
jgi:thiamine pyrophosphate-dependent acetolactate synthase large subunit-like protein